MFSNTVRIPMKLQKVVGICDISTENIIWRWLFSSYRILTLLVFVCVPNVLLIINLINLDSLAAFYENASFCTAYMDIFFRAFLIYRNRKLLRSFVNQMDSNQYSPQGIEEHTFYLAARKSAKSLTLGWNIYIFLTTFGTLMPSFLSEENTLSFTFWFPLKLKEKLNDNLIFNIMHMYQTCTGIFCATILCAVEVFLYVSLIYLKYDIQLLGNRLRKCGIENQNKKYINEALCNCVKMHVDIRILVDAFHGLFSILLFINISQSFFSIAITIVSMTASEMSSAVLIGKIANLGVFFLQYALICYLGNEIYAQSTELSTEAYFSEFLTFDLSTRKNFLFLLHSIGCRPMEITADGWCTLRLSLLLSISKTTYSYALVMMRRV